MRTNDAVLAHELNKVRDKAKHMGEADFMNRPHEKIEMPFPSSPELTLYIDSETHRISKMVRNNPQLGQLDYVFKNWTEDNGIPYASTSNFFVAGKPNLISVSNVSTFNRDLDSAMFEVPDNLTEEGERIDTSEMATTRISNTVHHVGQGGAFSVFVNTSAGLVAAGGSAGFGPRLTHYRKETGNYQPLAYQVVTHHHNDHQAGLRDAVDAGATLIAVDDNVSDIKQFGNVDDADFLLVEERLTIGTGRNRVDIYEVNTVHAARFLVTHVPSEKLIFIADHMNSPYKTGTPVANLNTVTMHQELERLDLDFNKIVVAHGARVFTKKDMDQSVADYEPLVCTADRPVCL